MRQNSTAFFFSPEVEHIVFCLGLTIATFVSHIHFTFVVQFFFFDLEILTIFPLQILAV